MTGQSNVRQEVTGAQFSLRQQSEAVRLRSSLSKQSSEQAVMQQQPYVSGLRKQSEEAVSNIAV